MDVMHLFSYFPLHFRSIGITTFVVLLKADVVPEHMHDCHTRVPKLGTFWWKDVTNVRNASGFPTVFAKCRNSVDPVIFSKERQMKAAGEASTSIDVGYLGRQVLNIL
jgi:hypothetical protein